MPVPQSDLAHQTLKDPYIFDFLTLTKEHNERDLELGLVKHITRFLLELGAGFAYIGRQVQLNVGERSFFPDLPFYHSVSEYQLTQSLPDNRQTSLPTVEEIEAELAGELR